jgi:hypothetical protein
VSTLLERLTEAKDSLDPGSGEFFDFSMWRSCTCGHIYRAANGSFAGTDAEVLGREEDGLIYEEYTEMLRAIVEANELSVVELPPGYGPGEIHKLTHTISEATRCNVISEDDEDDDIDGGEENRRLRESAWGLLYTAVEVEEQRQREYMRWMAAKSQVTAVYADDYEVVDDGPVMETKHASLELALA